MSPVLDTSILIDVLRGVEEAAGYVKAREDPSVCSEITRVEIVRGLRSGERDGAEHMFRALTWIPVDEAIARRAGELGRRYRRSHPGLGAPDLIVAATAEHLGMELATLNVRHFPMFEGLRPPYEP